MKGKRIFCFILLIFSLNTVFYAKEKDSMSLFEIDKLIRKTEYDEALRQLNIYIEKNPDQFDNVQARISKIMNAKIRYSELAEELIEIIRNDPTNNKKIYEITAELERFERNPSDEKLQFIADIKKSAEFNYFRAVSEDIQKSVAELNEDKKYLEAVLKAQEGFWLYKENFYVQWEDYPKIISGVEGVVNSLNEHLAVYEGKNFISEITKAVNDFVKEVNQDNYEGAIKKFNIAKQKLAQYNNVRTNIINDKLNMDKAVEELRILDPYMRDASYLPFLIHFLTGSDEVPGSGIITSLNNCWNDFIRQMNDSVFNIVMKKYNAYEDGITKEFSDELNKYVKLNENVIALYDLPNKKEETSIVNPLLDYTMLLTYLENLCSSSFTVNNLYLAVLNNQALQNGEIESLKNDTATKNPVSYLNKLISYSVDLEKLTPSRADFDNSYKQWSESYKNSSYDNFDGLTSQYEDTVTNIYNTKNDILKKSWDVITKYYIAVSDKTYNEIYLFTTYFDDYNNGLMTKLSDDELKEINKDITKVALYINKEEDEENLEDIGLFYRYPDITLEMVDYVNDEIGKRIKEIEGYKKELNKMFKKVPDWENKKDLSSIFNNTISYLDELIKKIGALSEDSERAYQDASGLIINSEIARNEGDIRFDEAKRALNKEDFSLARRKLQVSLTKYNEALSNQNDEKLRTEWDNKLQKLGEEIARRENELVVREVRELKNKAKDAYFNGRFDDAEKYLNQASAKWALTNVTEDPEIENLRNFVNTAISMKTGRDILPSAPQYPEMSQLINIARTSYDEGSKLLDEGKTVEASEQFEIAKASIRKVQYVYPLNQEAAIINLQISRIEDPEKFESEFANKIAEAKAACQNNETQQVGYANLLDYYKLYPNYPGLKDLIYQVEIDIGIRQKPVDNTGKIKAERYIDEAKKIFRKARGDNNMLNQALDKVNQALVILPYNEEAMDLKDKITMELGATKQTVLSTEDDKLYNNALTKRRQNNFVGAKNDIDKVWANPMNRANPDVIELRREIYAELE